jgi:hypothetical protein
MPGRASGVSAGRPRRATASASSRQGLRGKQPSRWRGAFACDLEALLAGGAGDIVRAGRTRRRGPMNVFRDGAIGR